MSMVEEAGMGLISLCKNGRFTLPSGGAGLQ
jgi:hypothetical protein